jgi:hypothetical protein
MKAIQLSGTLLLLAAFACNNPVKSPDQLSEESNAGKPSSEEIAAQAQNFKTQEGMRMSSTMIKGNYKFIVKVGGDGTGRTVSIGFADMRGDTTKPADSILIHDVKGKVVNSVVSDLDGDGNPEVFSFTRSDGTEAAGSVYGVAFVQKKGIRIFSGDVEKDSLEGYRGRDTFFVQQHYLVRKYPDYKAGDADSAPTGGMKTLKYALKQEGNRYVLKEAK